MTTAPDETLRAVQEIEARLTANPDACDRELARLIAATLHDGPGSALYLFASGDIVSPRQLLFELDNVDVPPEREAWVDTAIRFVLLSRREQQ